MVWVLLATLRGQDDLRALRRKRNTEFGVPHSSVAGVADLLQTGSREEVQLLSWRSKPASGASQLVSHWPFSFLIP